MNYDLLGDVSMSDVQKMPVSVGTPWLRKWIPTFQSEAATLRVMQQRGTNILKDIRKYRSNSRPGTALNQYLTMFSELLNTYPESQYLNSQKFTGNTARTMLFPWVE
jgi:hypothetical protein